MLRLSEVPQRPPMWYFWLLAIVAVPCVVWPLFLAVCGVLGLDVLAFLPEGEFKQGLIAEGTKKGFVTDEGFPMSTQPKKD